MPCHPFDNIEIRRGDPEKVRESLRLLPEDTFKYVKEFRRGLPECRGRTCGQIGIYAQSEPILGDDAISLRVIDEHLFGDPTDELDTPYLRIPEGATNIRLDSPRQPPLIKTPFCRATFDYKGRTFSLGYQLSGEAHSVIVDNLKKRED